MRGVLSIDQGFSKGESRACSIVGGGFNPKEWTLTNFDVRCSQNLDSWRIYTFN